MGRVGSGDRRSGVGWIAECWSCPGAAGRCAGLAWPLGHQPRRLIFYDLSYTDVGWDNSGREFSTCALNDRRYHWLLRGMWSWPEKPRQRKWVTIKGTPTGKGYDTVEPCWI